MSLAASVFYACKKDQNITDQHADYDETLYTPKAAKLVQDITAFKQKVTYLRENPQLKSGEIISKEDARWNLETLFNATYGFPDKAYRRTIPDTAMVYLPVDASGNAMLEDVVAVYDEILTLVTAFYINSNFEEKGFLFIQLQTGDITGDQMEIFVRAITGSRETAPPDDPPHLWRPFREGDNWRYGNGEGKCDYSMAGTDAADQLQIAIRKNTSAWPIPPRGFRWMTKNPFTIKLIGHEYKVENEYLIFYVENYTAVDECLTYTKMNFHYYGQKKVIYNMVPNDPKYQSQFEAMEDWVLQLVEIEGKNYTESYPRFIHHENKITYAERFLVPIEVMDLPIEITD